MSGDNDQHSGGSGFNRFFRELVRVVRERPLLTVASIGIGGIVVTAATFFGRQGPPTRSQEAATAPRQESGTPSGAIGTSPPPISADDNDNDAHPPAQHQPANSTVSTLDATHFRLLGLTIVAMVLCIAFLHAFVYQQLVTDFTLFAPMLMTGVGITIGSASDNKDTTQHPARNRFENSPCDSEGGGGSKEEERVRSPRVRAEQEPSQSSTMPYASSNAATSAAHDTADVQLGREQEDVASNFSAVLAIPAGAASEEAQEGGTDTSSNHFSSESQEETANLDVNNSPAASGLAEYDELVQQKKGEEVQAKMAQLLSEVETASNDARWRSDVLWRAAQLVHSKATGKNSNGDASTAQEKMAQLTEGVELAKRAVAQCETNAAAHKWFAILLSELTGLQGSKVQIASAMEIKAHIDRAMQLDDQDPMPPYMAGMWSFSFSNLSRMMRWFAQKLYGELPTTSMAQALEYFVLAETRSPGWWVKNTLMMGKCHHALKQVAQAKKHYEAALEFDVCDNDDDRAALEEARTLLGKL